MIMMIINFQQKTKMAVMAIKMGKMIMVRSHKSHRNKKEGGLTMVQLWTMVQLQSHKRQVIERRGSYERRKGDLPYVG